MRSQTTNPRLKLLTTTGSPVSTKCALTSSLYNILYLPKRSKKGIPWGYHGVTMGLPWVYPCISYQSYHFTSGSSLWVAEEVGRVEHRGERSHRMHPIQRPGDRNTGQLVGWQKNTTQHTLNIYFCWILLANVDILYAWLVVANFRKGNCWVWLLVKWILAVPANDAISLDRWWQFGKVAILGSVAKTESANIPILWWLCPKNIRIWESSHAGDKKKNMWEQQPSNLDDSLRNPQVPVLPPKLPGSTTHTAHLLKHAEPTGWIRCSVHAILALQRRRPRMRCRRKRHWPSSASTRWDKPGLNSCIEHQCATLKTIFPFVCISIVW